MSKPPNRWFGPEGSARFHYFNDELRSLCKKWMLWRDPETIEGLSWGVALSTANGDCAACVKALAKLYPDDDARSAATAAGGAA